MRSGDSLARARGEDVDLGAALADGGDPYVVVVAVAVEQHAGIADIGAQHPHQMPCSRLWQHDVVADRQRGLDMQPGQAHAVASSIAARVVSASSASCA